MFLDIPLLLIIGPAFILLIIFGIIYKAKTKSFNNEFEQSISNLKIQVIQLGVLLVVLWLSLPITSTLSTFDYPTDIDSVNTNEKILSYLQKYNRAITRTTEVFTGLFF